jgi:hypothetical protein
LQLLLIQWLDVVKSFFIEHLKQFSTLNMAARVIILSFVVALFVGVLPSACVTACYCTDENCSLGYDVSEDWLVIGLAKQKGL